MKKRKNLPASGYKKITQFLLDFIENEMNRGLDVTQTYIDIY